MKRLLYLATIMVALCGCAGHNHNSEEEHSHSHIHSFTAYTSNMEFFMQHEGLVAGEKSCITLYVTELSNFKPATGNEITATLKVGDKEQSVNAVAQHTGVFHFDFVPEAAGDGVLKFALGSESAHFHIEVHSQGEEHSHGEHAHSHAEHSHGEHAHSHSGHGEATDGNPGDITFTKEQSWKIDFATAVVHESSFGGVVKVAARVEPVPANFTTIVATVSGKVQFVGNVVAGKSVSSGEPLFYLEGGDVTDNDAAVLFAEAESNYELAKADFERKSLLFAERIVSEREYEAAEAAYRQAEARFNSMKRNFGGGKVTLRASIGGYVATLLVENGDYVQPGTPLATIQRSGDVNIVAELPVRYATQLQSVDSVNIELPCGRVYTMSEAGARLQAVGSAVNACNMVPVTVTATSIEGVIPGSIVTLYLASSTPEESGVAVPRTALVEEMGNFFVFVQNSPVSFEKRSVTVGVTDGVNVRITSGIAAGERVVTKGAISLKLSQGAAALDPHAGHVH